MLILLSLLLVADSPLTLAGSSNVDSLGSIKLPPGKWNLTRSHVSSVAAKTPDVFIFTKSSKPSERLTILRYGPHISPKQPVYLCDSIGDSSQFGIPHFLDANTAQRSTDCVVEMMRKPSDWYASKLSVTYVYPDADATMWMSNAIIFTQDQSAFVCIHCAAAVLSPAVLTDTVADSSFKSVASSK